MGAFQQAAGFINYMGKLPLHMACCQKASSHVTIFKFLEINCMMKFPLLFRDVEYVGRRRFLPVLLLMLGIFKDEYCFLLFSISGEGEKCSREKFLPRRSIFREKEKKSELGLKKKFSFSLARFSRPIRTLQNIS
jgi:hypothetical protein